VTVICAWCGRVLRHGGSELSHGICGACSRKVESRATRMWPLPAPPTRSRRKRSVAPTLPLPGFAAA
jgi:hypothetical protein